MSFDSGLSTAEIRELYDKYHNDTISINKKILGLFQIAMKNIIFKANNLSMNCVLYTLSMKEATIIVNIDGRKLAQFTTHHCTLKLAFKSPETKDLIGLHLDVKVAGTKPLNNDTGLFLLSLSFSKAPPDDLIFFIGSYLRNHFVVEKRKDERINFTDQTIKRMGFFEPLSYIIINNTSMKCIIKNISYSGVGLIAKGEFSSLIDQTIVLSIIEKLKGNRLDLVGRLVRSELVDGNNIISMLGIHFIEENIPAAYHNKIAEYFSTYNEKEDIPQ